MSERRDRSAERRADRARPSRDTGARARSRSPSRVDSGVDSSATNPYSTRDRDGRSTDCVRSRDGDRASAPAIPSAYGDRRRGRDSDSQDPPFRRDGAAPSYSGRNNASGSGSYDDPASTRGPNMEGMNFSSASGSQSNRGHQGGRQQSGGYGDQRSSRGGGGFRNNSNDGGRNFDNGGSYGGSRDSYGRGAGREGGGRGSGGFDRGREGGRYNDNGGNRGPPISSGPPLPDSVPIPPNGAETKTPAILPEGRLGDPIRVYANHFEIQSLPCMNLYQYDIRVTGDRRDGKTDAEEAKQCSPAIVKKIMQNPEIKGLLGPGFIFDGVSIGWSTVKLPFPNDAYRYHLDLPGRPGRTFGCNVDISLSGTFNTDSFVQWIRDKKGRTTLMGTSVNPKLEDQVQLCLKFLNALLRSDPSKRFISGQGSKSTTYFDRTPATTLALRSTGDVLEAWRGFYQTAIIRFGKLTVNVDTSTNAFIRPGINFLDAVAGLAGISVDHLEGAYIQRPHDLRSIMRKFVGVGFKCKHIKDGPKGDVARRVMRFTVKGATEETFERRKFTKDPEGGDDIVSMESTTVATYYLQQYNLGIRFPRLPMIESKKKEKYPMELCFVADGERWKETLQGAETADFIKFATGPAFLRKAQIEENLKKLAWHRQPELGAFGVSIKPQFMELEARVLPAPIPQYSRGTDSYAPAGGRWNLRNKTFHSASPVRGWGLIYFPSGKAQLNDERLREFAGNVSRAFSTYGMQVQRQDPPTAIANPQGDLKRTIAEMLRKIESLNGVRPNLVMFLLSVVATEPYATIKAICDTEFGIASQCMIVEKAFNLKGQQQYLGNISLKVNIKLGGINSCIRDPLISRRPTMVMGCDAAHPNPSQMRMTPPPPTFTALAANYDINCAKYTAVTSVQDPGKEIVDKFGPMAKELVRRFTRQTKKEPESILYFRDGVSEGEFATVLASELEALKKVTNAKITVIVCVKRHHTRIFPVVGGDKHGNVPPGTVVENGNGTDIFLVSHVGLQGTVRPTHYIVLFDENNLSVDQFQSVCNNLCYGYGRATVAVSMVPPVYYAHLACERSRQHVRHDALGKSTLMQVQENLKYSMWWQ